MILLAVVVVEGLYVIFRKPLYVLSFDEDTAMTAGLPVRRWQTSLRLSQGCDCSDDANRRVTSSVSRYCIPASIALPVSSKFNGVIIRWNYHPVWLDSLQVYPRFLYLRSTSGPRLHVCSWFYLSHLSWVPSVKSMITKLTIYLVSAFLTWVKKGFILRDNQWLVLTVEVLKWIELGISRLISKRKGISPHIEKFEFDIGIFIVSIWVVRKE